MTVKSTTDVDCTVGLRIATLRKAKGLSQTELGQHVGVTFQQIQKYEKGANRVSSGRLQQIAQFLEVPMSTLFGDHEAEEHNDAFGFFREAGAVDLLRAYATNRERSTALRRAAARSFSGGLEGEANPRRGRT